MSEIKVQCREPMRAIQWLPDGSNWREVIRFVDDTCLLMHYAVLRHLRLPDGRKVPRGGWVVKHPDGWQVVYEKEEFPAIFEEVKP